MEEPMLRRTCDQLSAQKPFCSAIRLLSAMGFVAGWSFQTDPPCGIGPSSSHLQSQTITLVRSSHQKLRFRFRSSRWAWLSWMITGMASCCAESAAPKAAPSGPQEATGDPSRGTVALPLVGYWRVSNGVKGGKRTCRQTACTMF